MTHFRRMLLQAALLGMALPLGAQERTPAPRILQVYQEMIKPGKVAAHAKHEAGWPIAFASARIESYYHALASQTGTNDVWYVSAYGSYADWHRANEAIAKVPGLEARLGKLSDGDADYLANARSFTAELRDSLSIGTPPNFAKVRGYRISTVRLRMGQTDEWSEARRLINQGWQRSGTADPHIGVYQVTHGVNTPTFLIFRAYESLTDVDGWEATNRRAYEALTADERAKYDRLLEGSILTSEQNLYAVSPEQSYVHPQLAAQNMEFWKTNPVVAMQAKQGGATQAGKPRKP